MGYQTERFRHHYRQEIIPNYYSGMAHLLFSLLALFGTFIFLLLQLENPVLSNFLIVPFMFFVGGLVVFLLHRYPLHRPLPGMKFAYRIHTLYHHTFFTHQQVTWNNIRDFHIVFFPPLVVAGFCILGVPLIYFGLASFLSHNTALLGAATSAAYFLAYEFVHFCSHLPEDHWLLINSSYLRRMREHHRLHHDPSLMADYNFNIVFPFWDRVLGTDYSVAQRKQSKSK